MASEQIARIDDILLKCHEDISLCNELMEKFNIEKQKRSPGRPCLGDAPLTPAEKQRRYRERQKLKIVTVTETQPSGGIHLSFHPKTELPEPGRSVVVRYRDHRRSWYNWGTSSEMLIAILKVKPSQWHTREELTRSKELVVDWAYVPDVLPYPELDSACGGDALKVGK